MTDRDRHRLRGPVHTMRTENSEWDAAAQSWAPPRGHEIFTFHPDGRAIDIRLSYGGQASHTIYRYDSSGRLTQIDTSADGGPATLRQFHFHPDGRAKEVVVVNPDGSRLQAEAWSYDSDGRPTRTVHLVGMGLPDDEPTDIGSWHAFIPGASEPEQHAPVTAIRHDDGRRPIEALSYDANHLLRFRVTMTRDRQGRLLTADTVFAGLGALIGTQTPPVPESERAQLEAALEAAFEQQTFMSVRYAYDSAGRVVEEVRRMGTLLEDVRTLRYDDRGEQVETSSVSRSHGLNGADLQPTDVEHREARTRFEYQYDAHDNWTERVTWSQAGDAPDFQRAAIDRRAFTYW